MDSRTRSCEACRPQRVAGFRRIGVGAARKAQVHPPDYHIRASWEVPPSPSDDLLHEGSGPAQKAPSL